MYEYMRLREELIRGYSYIYVIYVNEALRYLNREKTFVSSPPRVLNSRDVRYYAL